MDVMRNEHNNSEPLLPEWNDGGEDLDEATWVAEIEASRRAAFAELADL